MSDRRLRLIGDPVLRKRARELTPDEIRTAGIQSLIDEMIEIKRRADGAGIAANQVGEALRIAIAEVEGVNPRYPYKPEIPLTVIINPEIEALDSETFVNNEGCLSVPDLRGNLPRQVNIRLRYLDRDGVAHSEVKHGLTAGTFQHEVDHLDGILFLDRVVDRSTLATWDEFERHQKEEFTTRITDFVERVGS